MEERKYAVKLRPEYANGWFEEDLADTCTMGEGTPTDMMTMVRIGLCVVHSDDPFKHFIEDVYAGQRSICR